MLHGAIIMPSVRNDPLEIAAAWFSGRYVRSASAITSAGRSLVSIDVDRSARSSRTP